MQAMYSCATEEKLQCIWDKDIAANPGDKRWPRWKEQYMGYHRSGMAHTYLAMLDGEPVGQGTLIFSPECGAIGGRLALADGKTVGNINALRIEKAYEGQGHISRLVWLMETEARTLGYQALTIGVEAKETRNLAIYLHWGYNQLVMAQEEDGELVLYYRKEL